MSLAKLTSLSTQTLSLLLERQRVQTFSSSPLPPTLHLPQITKNLGQLRAGIVSLEKDGQTEAVTLLRSQYERMRGMLGADSGVESLDPPPGSALSSSSHLPRTSFSQRPPTPPLKNAATYTPYTDDPEAGYQPGEMLQTQRQMMDEQDTHLDHLSHSINRQHHISLQINDELEVHTGLLEELDTELDTTHNRLGGARRRLDKFAKGAKENGSTVTIALLILVLLILIIVFKT